MNEGPATLCGPASSVVSDPFNFPQQEAIRYGPLLQDALIRLQTSGQLILGDGVRAFEAAFARWLDPALTPEAVIGVANGTEALELALRGSGVGPGDAVLLPSHTAYATLAAVLRLEARPVFVDLELERSVLSPMHLQELLEGAAALGEAPPKAVIAVHLYGEACDLGAIEALCAHHGVALIEDCAQACGTTVQRRSVGTWGRFAAFSFYPTKNLAAFGDGGALVANHPQDRQATRRLRFYGWDEERRAVQAGVNSRLDELQAWVLLGKLADLPERIGQRRRVAGWYAQRLDGLVALPGDGVDWRHSYHLHVVRLPGAQRERLLQEASREGLPLGVHYPLACHQHPYVIDRFGPQSLPETERRVREVLSLPLHPYLEEERILDVCARLIPLLSETA
ncbi:DegT/DnrJ/EryC1/StrS family aminotransferase [Synechococcus sp. Tobar12-5m-g]|uniref:DegT/DnrJ/EryC1/StrS family aminotransferase n=1 Tax=unclassified Synechococcus TaxID=2626047 RepID=UPI0020CF575F|nr:MULTISPECIES: DegT/DnrJ/EryC1/StrS family aminotransferase [unclassified Synechococcus]MCP9772349.1 DegT/DnrJ/EryC1/StrS family aminotransferase [Synechococcus sp. Tobar12-5m-g]MCP9873291.1 DegT/DnrJ/EryC1/StrS family aminotransferase [Synechococcus sp. Cruz CV-v-12]